MLYRLVGILSVKPKSLKIQAGDNLVILTIEDRIEIQNLLANYCFSLDDLDWESFSTLFHPNAILDFTAIGGPKGNPRELIEFLKVFATHVSSWQHTTSTNTLKSLDNYIKSRTAAQVMTITKSLENTDHVAFYGLWYKDKIIKEQNGWLINERVLQSSWSHNVPAQ
jgi:SnoaL-like domain